MKIRFTSKLQTVYVEGALVYEQVPLALKSSHCMQWNFCCFYFRPDFDSRQVVLKVYFPSPSSSQTLNSILER